MLSKSKFVLGSYEINEHFSDIDFLPRYTKIGWMDTAITYNNDYFIPKDPKVKLISKISPFMYKNYHMWVSNHLKALGRDKIDIMLLHNTRHEDWLNTYGKMIHDVRFGEVGVSNVKISQLELIKEKYGSYPKWIETEINPKYHTKESIRFCKSNGIKIIAYAIFGGKYNAKDNIKNFTLDYLINFAYSIADKVIIRFDSLDEWVDINEVITKPKSKVKLDASEFLSKSIVPEIYSNPKVVKLLNGFPVYSGLYDEISVNKFDSSKFKIVKNPPELEFITEYQAYIRYNNKYSNIAILDDKGELTKVYKKGYKIIVR